MERRQFTREFKLEAVKLITERGVTVVQAYFDESGHSRDQDLSHVVAIGGGISDPDRWTSLASEWKKILERFGVTWFHAVDYAHSRNEFEGWKGDKPKRANFMIKLLEVIRRHVRVVVGAAVPLISHRLFEMGQAAVETETDIDGPYHVCFKRCLEISVEHAKALPAGEKIEILFAKLEGMVGRSAKIHKEFQSSSHPLAHHMGDIMLDREPKTCIPLQVADLVAYELAYFLKDQNGHRRRPMIRLLQMKHDFKFLDLLTLRGDDRGFGVLATCCKGLNHHGELISVVEAEGKLIEVEWKIVS